MSSFGEPRNAELSKNNLSTPLPPTVSLLKQFWFISPEGSSTSEHSNLFLYTKNGTFIHSEHHFPISFEYSWTSPSKASLILRFFRELQPFHEKKRLTRLLVFPCLYPFCSSFRIIKRRAIIMMNETGDFPGIFLEIASIDVKQFQTLGLIRWLLSY